MARQTQHASYAVDWLEATLFTWSARKVCSICVHCYQMLEAALKYDRYDFVIKAQCLGCKVESCSCAADKHSDLGLGMIHHVSFLSVMTIIKYT